MKNQLTKLSELNIDLDLFYSIRIERNYLIFQGHLSAKTRSILEEKGFKFILDQNDWIESNTIDGINIILTF